jgi:hypothetical protein
VTPRRKVGCGQQFAQAQVAAAILHQQQQACGIFLLLHRIVVADPDIAADDGLDTLAARRGVELDHAEQVGEVGDGQRRLAVRRRTSDYTFVQDLLGLLIDNILYPDKPISDRVFAVQTKVDEGWKGGRGRHGALILPLAVAGQTFRSHINVSVDQL